MQLTCMWGSWDESLLLSEWVKSLSRVRLFATPWTVAYQASLSMGFSRQEYWSGLPFPSPGDLPNPGIEPGSPALEIDPLTSEPPGKPKSLLFGEQLMVSPINCFLQGEFWRWTSCICSLVSLMLWVKVARTHLTLNIFILSKRFSYCLLRVMWGFGMFKFSEASVVAFGWKRGKKIRKRVKHVLP